MHNMISAKTIKKAEVRARDKKKASSSPISSISQMNVKIPNIDKYSEPNTHITRSSLIVKSLSYFNGLLMKLNKYVE